MDKPTNKQRKEWEERHQAILNGSEYYSAPQEPSKDIAPNKDIDTDWRDNARAIEAANGVINEFSLGNGMAGSPYLSGLIAHAIHDFAQQENREWISVKELERRVSIIKSEPDGMTRETMIDLLPSPPKE